MHSVSGDAIFEYQIKRTENMTNQELKNASKEEALKFLNPVIEQASQMLLSGVLKKNVVRFFVNKGLPLKAAENFTDVAEVRAENYSNYKLR